MCTVQATENHCVTVNHQVEVACILTLQGLLGTVVQSVASSTTDPGVARSHTFVQTDHEIIFTAILLLPLIQEGCC